MSRLVVHCKKEKYDVYIGTPIRKPDGFRTAQYTAGFSLNVSF